MDYLNDQDITQSARSYLCPPINVSKPFSPMRGDNQHSGPFLIFREVNGVSGDDAPSGISHKDKRRSGEYFT